MKIDDTNINYFLDKYTDFVDKISEKYNYPDNIRHVLCLIIPAFVVKYGLNKENLVINCFKDIVIYIHENVSGNCTAYFSRIMNRDLEGKYYTSKKIVLNNYSGYNLIDLLDNIIHEYNHAINSINNEILFDDKEVKMRTGLSYVTYDKDDIKHVKKRSEDIILEEIINTKQTEDIIKIIKSFSKYKIENEEFNTALYQIDRLIKDDYVSDAYYLQSYICKELMKNKTFIPTVENLRLAGNTDDIEKWFDDITGIKKSYQELVTLLNKVMIDETKLSKTKFFRNYHINKIKEKMRKIMEIVRVYEDNCVYK